MSGPERLVVGTLGRAVGLRGELEVRVWSDDPRRFVPGSVLICSPDGPVLTVSAARRHRERLIVSFREVRDRDAAQALRGRDLVVSAGDVRKLAKGEYWDHELIGCAVVTAEGGDVGVVQAVWHGPANDVLEAGGHLIPLVSGIVCSVDVGTRRIVVRDVPGLLRPD